VAQLTQRQEKVLEGLLYLSRREERPPTTRELGDVLAMSTKTVYQYLLTLENKMVLRRVDGRVLFTPEFRVEWPPLVLGDLCQAIAAILHARHCSIHFRVGTDRLVCPRASFPCRISDDYVTDLSSQSSTTAFMAGHPGQYSFSEDELAAQRSRLRGEPITSMYNPAYGAECSGLIAQPIHIDGEDCGLIKVEAKLPSPHHPVRRSERPFSLQDQILLAAIVEHAEPALARALAWVRETRKDAEVSSDGWC